MIPDPSQYYNLNLYPPETYQAWYNSLPIEYQQMYYHPTYYYQFYYSQANMYQTQQPKKSTKLSRNQKRKLKKQKLKSEYEEEKKQIGKWVDLERKDLVEGLQKIQQQEEKIKEKKREKFSHLIEIHKEVYKHAVRRNKVVKAGQKTGNFRAKKKKPSLVKKMKLLFQGMKEKKKNQHHEQPEEENDGFVTQSDNEEQMTEKQLPNSHEKEEKVLTCIEYKKVGKLSGQKWHDITIRQWVDHIPSVQLEDRILRLINRLAYKQAIKKVQNPQKAKKLIVAGIHECKRTLWTTLEKKRSRLLIVALNIERNHLKGGIDDEVQKALEYAQEAKIPVAHVSTRGKLGRAFTGKFGPRQTMISIINFEGYQDMMENVMQEWKKLKQRYDNSLYICL